MPYLPCRKFPDFNTGMVPESALLCRVMPPRSRNRFDNHRNSLPAADARAGDAVACTAPAQFQQQTQDQACSGGRERMSQGDRTAIHVGLVAVQPQLFSTARYCAANASFTST